VINARAGVMEDAVRPLALFEEGLAVPHAARLLGAVEAWHDALGLPGAGWWLRPGSGRAKPCAQRHSGRSLRQRGEGRALSRGTVTFLFTDIEGSTRLWEQHPEAMHAVLARHDGLLRAAIETHHGQVFKSWPAARDGAGGAARRHDPQLEVPVAQRGPVSPGTGFGARRIASFPGSSRGGERRWPR
jgi:hypothetical protein